MLFVVKCTSDLAGQLREQLRMAPRPQSDANLWGHPALLPETRDSAGLTAANSHAVIARALLRIFGRTPVRICIAGVLTRVGVVSHRELTQTPVLGELWCAEEFLVVVHVVTSIVFLAYRITAWLISRKFFALIHSKTQFSLPKLNFPVPKLNCPLAKLKFPQNRISS